MSRVSYLLGCASCAALLASGVQIAHAAGVGPDLTSVKIERSGVASLLDLANSPANTRQLRAQSFTGPRATLRHRYPDGSLVRTPDVNALPVMAQANTIVIGPRLASPPASVTGFVGVTGGSNGIANGGGELEPPDQGLAVNNNQVVEIVNNTIQIFNATGKALSQPLANATFFNVTDGDNLSDPHAEYDPTTQRWFIEELRFGSAFNGFMIAVSQTSNPLGKYNLYKIDALTAQISACGGSCLPDYPQVGYDANGFYIAADLFSNSSGNFVDAAIYALPKAALVAGTTANYFGFLTQDFVVQPSIPAPGQAFSTAANGTEYLMAGRNIIDGSSNLRVFALTNTNSFTTATPALKLLSVDVAAEAYTATVPSTQPNKVGPYGKSQGAKSSPKLDAGYNALGGGVKYAANTLYTALTSGSKDSKGLARDVIAWFAVTPSATTTAVTATIKKQGYIVPADGYSISYPGMALNKAGTGIIGMTITNTSATVAGGYPSTAYIEFVKNATVGTVSVTGAGAASDDGFTGYNGSTAGTGRWGDYASATTDPKTGHFWVGNEFIPNTTKNPRGMFTNWGTFLTQVH